MKYDSAQYRYPSKRIVVYGKKGMVCTSQPLAAQAGLEILKKGGNAVDAAIAAAACLPVVEPTCNGLGGDAFAILWTKDNQIFGLNASGPAPMGISAKAVRERGFSEMPRFGWIPVNVPGLVAGWAALSERFGRLPFRELVEPAALYAEEGYPVPPTVAQMWAGDYALHKKELTAPEFQHWFSTFAPQGRAPRTGEIFACPEMAATLREIGETHGETVYRGALSEKIDAFSRATGGYLRREDLAAYRPQWVEPVSVNYRGYDVWEIPPNGSGIVAQMALNILKGFSFVDREDVDTYHKQIEAMKLAFADGMRYIADPAHMKASVKTLLSDEFAALRRGEVGERARRPEPADPNCCGTVYLCAADEEGNMISYIQSNYMGFGSGLVVPGTGFALHNRGKNFSLDEAMENCLGPGKRPYHTILPAFLSKDGRPVGPFGVMGAFMQPQGHVQVVMNTVDFAMNPQDALNAPRWQWTGGMTIEVEPEFPRDKAEALRELGHDIVYARDSMTFGRGQIIWREENGVYAGATEPRTDGTVAVW